MTRRYHGACSPNVDWIARRTKCPKRYRRIRSRYALRPPGHDQTVYLKPTVSRYHQFATLHDQGGALSKSQVARDFQSEAQRRFNAGARLEKSVAADLNPHGTPCLGSTTASKRGRQHQITADRPNAIRSFIQVCTRPVEARED